jgi:hypothetical protein
MVLFHHEQVFLVLIVPPQCIQYLYNIMKMGIPDQVLTLFEDICFSRLHNPDGGNRLLSCSRL